MTTLRAAGFFLPAAAVATAFLMNPQPEAWYLYIGILVAAEVAVFWLFEGINRDVEFHSGYYWQVRHYYSWVERVETTQTRTDSNGRTHTTRQVSYRTHPEYWTAYLNTKEEINISRQQFLYCSRLWNTGLNYFPTHHHNQVRGGGGEASAWNKEQDTMQTATYKKRYKNYLQDTNSIFNPRRVTREEAKREGLIPYPKIIDNTQEPLCVSPGVSYAFSDEDQMLFRRLNARMGLKHQIHFFVLLFPAEKGVGISLRQRQYWEGGNKNEFTICLGVEQSSAAGGAVGDDTSGPPSSDSVGITNGAMARGGTESLKVRWCKPFSWMDAPTLEVALQDWYIENPMLDMLALEQWLTENIDLWKRKQFSDFKYLGRHLSPWKSAMYLLLTVGICVLVFLLLLNGL